MVGVKSSKYFALYTGKIHFKKFFRFIKNYSYLFLDLINFNDVGN